MLLEALMKTSRLCAMLLAVGQGTLSFAAASPASAPDDSFMQPAWLSPASSSESESAIGEAVRELQLARQLLHRLELHVSDEAVGKYLRDLEAILDAAPDQADQLAARAGFMAVQLAAARTQLISTTASSGVWLAVAKAVAPDAAPFRIPARLVKRAAAPGPQLCLEDVEDVLIAQDALAIPAV